FPLKRRRCCRLSSARGKSGEASRGSSRPSHEIRHFFVARATAQGSIGARKNRESKMKVLAVGLTYRNGEGGSGRVSRAFTLIELLVVVAIIALLISILLPALSNAREQAKATKCAANLSAVGKAVHTYLAENRSMFPLSYYYASDANGG